ncbi:MAG: thioesterase [Defluviitaleaceae bacterium]|nr:thioesterase [Defluviitaleaceae bacterium]
MIHKNDIFFSFYDINARGDVTLTALLQHINLAAGANAEKLGIGTDVIIPLGITFVLQRFSVRIMQWAKFKQTATIRTWPAEITKGTFRRNGDLYDCNGTKIAEWTGLWVLIDVAERRVRRPKALPVTIPAHGLLDVQLEVKKFELPQNAVTLASYTHTVQFSETDVNYHMNNAIYGNLIANVVEKISQPAAENPKTQNAPTNWQQVHFNYLAEAKIGEQILVECKQHQNTLYIIGTTAEHTVFTAEIC